jgi:hypothetical protein
MGARNRSWATVATPFEAAHVNVRDSDNAIWKTAWSHTEDLAQSHWANTNVAVLSCGFRSGANQGTKLLRFRGGENRYCFEQVRGGRSIVKQTYSSSVINTIFSIVIHLMRGSSPLLQFGIRSSLQMALSVPSGRYLD